MKKAVLVVVQIAFLAAICQLGYLCTATLQMPVPGNLLGMLLLLAALKTGLVRLEWIESGAALLLTHLAFFFIPIAVGLMAFGDLLQSKGVALLLTLAIAAAVGIALAGLITQALARRSAATPRRAQA